MFRKIFTGMFILAIGIGCSGEEDTTGSIKGEVYDAQSGSVIALANVYTAPPSGSVTTDSSGVYNLENLDPGIYRVIANKFGYDSSSVSVSVSAGNVTKADLPLDPDSSETVNLFLILE